MSLEEKKQRCSKEWVRLKGRHDKPLFMQKFHSCNSVIHHRHCSLLNTAEKYYLDTVICSEIWEQTWWEGWKTSYLWPSASYYKACLVWLTCKMRRVKLLYSQTYFEDHILKCQTFGFDLLNFNSSSSNFLSEWPLEARSFWRYG